jgi:hypothetical protein
MSLEFLAAYLALCLIAGIAGRKRRIGFWGYLFCSIIFTPFLSLMFLYFATPRKVRRPGSVPR